MCIPLVGHREDGKVHELILELSLAEASGFWVREIAEDIFFQVSLVKIGLNVQTS